MQVLTDTDTTRKTVRLRLPGVVVAALFVLLTLASAYVSLMMWGLGVGVQQSTHYTVGIVFAAIHAGEIDDKLLAYQYLQMLPQLAQGDSNKVWIIPADLTDTVSKVAGVVAPYISSQGTKPGGV